MPAATDIRNLIADRLWVLFEAQATITTPVLAGNRNKGDEAGWLRDFIARAPADKRRLEVSFGRFTNSLYTTREGFSQEKTTFTSSDADDFDVKRTLEAVIVYREPLPNDPGTHAIAEAIEQTLFLAGPTLGLPLLVETIGAMSGETRQTREGEFPNPGRITTFRLPITTYQSARTLITETV